jgi:hypothetical protein
MIKQQTVIEIEVKGRDYKFSCSPDSPFVDVCEALAAMHQLIVQKINDIQEKQEQEAAQKNGSEQ